MNLVCMALYNFFLSLQVAKEMLKPAFEILPQRAEELPQH
jgi:hypothetical protein